MNKLFAVIGSIVVISGLWSCNSSAVDPFENPNLTDTSGVVISLGLFISAEVDGVPITYFNGENGYSNWAYSSQNGFCTADTNPFGFIQVHSTGFHIPTKRENSMYVDVAGCIPVDSNTELHIDSVLFVGNYPFLNLNDTAFGAQVRYIDQDSILWSTSFGDNNSSSTRFFQISAILDAAEGDSGNKLVYGSFSGMLFNGRGDSLELRKGQFKGRMGKY